MGQFESKLGDGEGLDAPGSPDSHQPFAGTGSASPPQESISPRSPTSSGSRASLGSSPSRSFFSFLQTPEKRLIEAAKRGEDEEVAVLLADGANVNTKTTLKKETPLHKAAQYGNVGSVLLLLAEGADPRAAGNAHHLQSNYCGLPLCSTACQSALEYASLPVLTPALPPSDHLGHTPSKSMRSRAVADPGFANHISHLLAACEFLLYDVLDTHGVSLRPSSTGQLRVLQVLDNSIAATQGLVPAALT